MGRPPPQMPEPVHPDEGIRTDVELPKQSTTVSDRRKRLEQAAGVSFHDDAEAELLVHLVKNWDEARGVRMSDQLQKLLWHRQQVRALGGEVTAFELERHDDSPVREVTERQWPQYTLRVLIQAVAEIWREHGGKGVGSYYSDPKGQHDGPLLRLLLELFEQAGVPNDRRPGRHSLHDAITKRNFPPAI
jgi:hypothetical protein